MTTDSVIRKPDFRFLEVKNRFSVSDSGFVLFGPLCAMQRSVQSAKS